MKIIIVGGGTSGWMSAATLKKRYPNYHIEVIESDSVPPIGVGESTTQFFSIWLHYLGLEPKDWMPHCDATYKVSVRFHNFHDVGDVPWQYPFGNPKTDAQRLDVWFRDAMINKWDNSRLARDHWISAELATQNVIGDFPNFKLGRDNGYHFDASKFAIWLRDNYCLPRGVIHTRGHVEDITYDDDGVKELWLEGVEDPVTADLFIDCTGFKSMLNQTGWKEYDFLPNDRAWVTRVDYRDKTKEMVNCTDCTALSSGWVWNVPTWDRIGTGYVFSSKYQDEKDALVEFQDHLDDRVSENQAYRLIKFSGGRRTEGWWKNVVSIGLSGGFLEPLESNGLLSVHEFLFYLIRAFGDRQVITQQIRDIYNRICAEKFDDFAAFIGIHYSYTQRNDSPYWKAVTQRSIHGATHDYAQGACMITPFKINDAINFHASDSIPAIWGGHGFNPWNEIVENEIRMYGYEVFESTRHTYKDWDLSECMNTYEYYTKTLYGIT